MKEKQRIRDGFAMKAPQSGPQARGESTTANYLPNRRNRLFFNHPQPHSDFRLYSVFNPTSAGKP